MHMRDSTILPAGDWPNQPPMPLVLVTVLLLPTGRTPGGRGSASPGDRIIERFQREFQDLLEAKNSVARRRQKPREEMRPVLATGPRANGR